MRRLLSTFKLASDTNRILERAAPRLLPFFMPKPPADALNPRVALFSKTHEHRKERMLSSYSAEINYSLGTYVTDDVIAKMDAEVP